MMRVTFATEAAMNEGGRSGWSLRGSELFGILLIGIGVLYFLNNANVLRISWDVLWPIVLVAFGALFLVQALRPADQSAGAGTAPLASGPGGGPAPAGGGSAIRVQREGTQQLEFDLGVGAGTFRVGGGAAELVEARSIREDIFARFDRSGQRTRVQLRQDANWLPWAFRGGTEWDVQIAEDVPTAFSLHAGAGDFTIDLSKLRIVDARLSIGAARMHLVLPRPNGEVNVKVTAGASDVSIQIPDGVQARVRSEGGLLRVEGRGETPDYATSRDRVTVSISGGASSVRVL